MSSDDGWQQVESRRKKNPPRTSKQDSLEKENTRTKKGGRGNGNEQKSQRQGGGTTNGQLSGRSESSASSARSEGLRRKPVSISPKEVDKGSKTTKIYGIVNWVKKPLRGQHKQVQFDQALAMTQKLEFINVSLNYFGLKNLKLPEIIHHYEVTMTRSKGKPGKSTKDKKSPQLDTQKILQQTIAEIYRQYEERHSSLDIGVISDLSNNIYSTKDLATSSVGLVHEIVITNDDGGAKEDFTVKVTKTVGGVNTKELTKYALEHLGSWKGMTIPTSLKTQTEQIYNALIKSIPPCRFVPVGRSGLIWWPENDGTSLGNAVVAWKGVYANFTIGWNFHMNMDITYGTFHKSGSALDVIEELTSWKRTQKWKGDNIYAVNSVIKNCRVIYKVRDITFRNKTVWKEITGKVSEVCKESAEDFHFVNTNTNRKMSVVEYYKITYGMRIEYPNGPCLLFNAGRSRVPAEFCTFVKGKAYAKQLKDKQTSALMKLSRLDPNDLKHRIEKSLTDIMRPSQCQELDQFGVQFQDELLNKNVLVLRPPDILYGEGLGQMEGKCARFTPEFGEWNIWDQGQQFAFHDAKNIPKFGFLVISNRYSENYSSEMDKQIYNFIKQLKIWSSKRRVRLECETKIIIENIYLTSKKEDASDNVKLISRRLKENFKDKGCKLAFVTLPDKTPETYGQVKRSAEIEVGILTQCIQWDNVVGCAEEVLQNLVLKLNCKLGGTNHCPIFTSKGLEEILQDPVLILGADVTHPPPNLSARSQISPSFSAVTGCFEKNIMPYAMDIKAQEKANKGAAEIIRNLDTTVTEMLQLYKDRTNGCLPKRIMMFRDGVGEGQFKEVLDHELAAIKKACDNFPGENGKLYKPPITFITVQKRNKTRFFKHDGNDKNNISNAPAGTLMDTDIVHQTDVDYYLLSHRGLLGTSCPTRYRVLHDESNFSLETLKTFTFSLCFIYQRCNKSVRMPAPTYYAHNAATRAKVFAEGLDKKQLTSLAAINQSLMRDQEFKEAYPMHYI